MKYPTIFHLVATEFDNPDLVDIVDLVKANRVDASKESFRELCLKYGTQELYDEVVKGVTGHG